MQAAVLIIFLGEIFSLVFFLPRHSHLSTGHPITNQSKAAPSVTTVSPIQSPGSVQIKDFIYRHNSQVLVKSSTTLKELSSDNPQQITNWYKDKFKHLNLSTNTAVVTETNSSVSNLLAGSLKEQTITVKINKLPDSQITNIEVEVNNQNAQD